MAPPHKERPRPLDGVALGAIAIIVLFSAIALGKLNYSERRLIKGAEVERALLEYVHAGYTSVPMVRRDDEAQSSWAGDFIVSNGTTSVASVQEVLQKFSVQDSSKTLQQRNLSFIDYIKLLTAELIRATRLRGVIINNRPGLDTLNIYFLDKDHHGIAPRLKDNCLFL